MDVNSISGNLGKMMMPMGSPPPKPPADADEMAASVISDLDTNGDGVISADELSAAGALGEKVSQADTDGDGAVTEEELIAKITEKMEEMGAPQMPSDGSQFQMHELKGMLANMGIQGPPPPPPDADKIMTDLDVNGDGSLDADELSAAGGLGEKVSQADADGDGVVTLEELQTQIANEFSEKTGNEEMNFQTGYDIISNVLEQMGMSGDDSDKILQMLEDYPFDTLC